MRRPALRGARLPEQVWQNRFGGMVPKMRQRGMAQQEMKKMRGLLTWVAVFAAVAGMGSLVGAEEPTPAAQAGFDAYVQRLESRIQEMRLARERGQAGTILAPVDWQRVRAGEVVV